MARIAALLLLAAGCSYFADMSTPHAPWKREPACGNRTTAAVIDTTVAAFLTGTVIAVFVSASHDHGDTKVMGYRAGMVVSAIDLIFLPAAVKGWIGVAHCRTGVEDFRRGVRK